ncbi:MAG: sulfite exporter TauE/SafE family protein [Methylophilaceae bacterium]|nr:sulfite exporter TauE/SafE family protein [Methylophilaceae bacterium]
MDIEKIAIVSAMKLRDLDFSPNPVNEEHRALGLPPVEESVTHPGNHPILTMFAWLAGFLILAAMAYLGMRLFDFSGGHANLVEIVREVVTSPVFWSAVGVGVIAQTIDGALGMAYGITSMTFLMATGVSPAVATASVHIAEVFTTGVSGIAHVRMQNVNPKLFFRLLLPGITGAVAGAYLVSSVDGKLLKPYVSAYLLIMGLYILSKVFRKIRQVHHEPRHVAKLALFGGFMDSAGGGGWGPIVTTTLIGSGHDPRTTIGSVNFAEFFLTFGCAIAFSILVEDGPWPVVAGLVIGGIFTAPLAAFLTRKLSTRVLLILVGLLITTVSAFNLYKAHAV